MCGRFTLRTPASAIVRQFDLMDAPELAPRYNVAPTQPLAAVRFDAAHGRRILSQLHWGLVPSWADDPSVGNRMINARGETVADKPSFRAAFKKRRCLILADGFYEWQKTGAKKQPQYIHRIDQAPFAFAGLWETWQGADRALETCTIITTDANDLMRPIHDRMPVILSPETYAVWLDPAIQSRDALLPLIAPCPVDGWRATPVSTWVNSPTHEDARCIEPA